MSIKPCKSPLSYLKTASSESVCSRASVCFLRGWCWLRRHGHNIKTDSIQRGRWGLSQSCILCSLLSLSYFRLFCVCFLFLAFCFLPSSTAILYPSFRTISLSSKIPFCWNLPDFVCLVFGFLNPDWKCSFQRNAQAAFPPLGKVLIKHE